MDTLLSVLAAHSGATLGLTLAVLVLAMTTPLVGVPLVGPGRPAAGRLAGILVGVLVLATLAMLWGI
jgi:hypothetical protein